MTRTGESGLMSPWTGASASPIKTEFNRLSSWRNKLYKRSARQIASWTPREHLFFFRPKEGLGEERHHTCTSYAQEQVPLWLSLVSFFTGMLSLFPSIRQSGNLVPPMREFNQEPTLTWLQSVSGFRTRPSSQDVLVILVFWWRWKSRTRSGTENL